MQQREGDESVHAFGKLTVMISHAKCGMRKLSSPSSFLTVSMSLANRSGDVVFDRFGLQHSDRIKMSELLLFRTTGGSREKGAIQASDATLTHDDFFEGENKQGLKVPGSLNWCLLSNKVVNVWAMHAARR